MPVNTALITAAGILGSSQNPALQAVWAATEAYNNLPNPLPPASRLAAVRLLDKLMKRAAVYLTSKPPQAGKATNAARWDALTDLANQAAVEAQALDVKLLQSPADFRQIKFDPKLGAQSYWLERVDPLHRAGYKLSQAYEQWLLGGSAVHGKSSFWDYVSGQAMSNVLFLKEGDVAGDGTPVRECYRVHFSPDGTARNIDGSLFATRDLETAHSGAGWAVFVVDPEGKMYARAHEAGYFHHSTFLAGRPVAAAGELLSDDSGRIRFITAKTGHYRAGVVEMVRMVTLIPNLPSDAFVLADFPKMLKPPAGIGEAHLYALNEFRVHGTAAPIQRRAAVQAKFPAFGQGAHVTQWINRVPL